MSWDAAAAARSGSRSRYFMTPVSLASGPRRKDQTGGRYLRSPQMGTQTEFVKNCVVHYLGRCPHQGYPRALEGENLNFAIFPRQNVAADSNLGFQTAHAVSIRSFCARNKAEWQWSTVLVADST